MSATFDITWRPFYLDPAAPDPSVDRTAHYAARFGAAQAAAMTARLTAIGAADGIRFAFGGRTGRTRDSHRLIELGREKGVQTAVVEALFRAYFEDEQDITQISVLVAAAEAAGIAPAEATAWLQGEGGGAVVDREVAQAKLAGISGVPHFTFNGAHKMSGAQEPAAFLEVFEFFEDE